MSPGQFFINGQLTELNHSINFKPFKPKKTQKRIKFSTRSLRDDFLT